MMKRDEAVQKLATVGHLSMAHAEDLYDSLFEKPVVKQCVADWYEKHKYNLESDIYYLIRCWEDEERTSDFYKWFDNSKNEAIKILVNMHQFGYEVEEEPRYTVRLKNKYRDYLVDTTNEGFRFYSNLYTQNRAHTRKKLESNGFGWVFDCPGVEVKEVDDGKVY